MPDEILKPQSAPFELLQLTRTQFLDTLSEGIPLIVDNVIELWGEANEIAQHGNRRAVGILQAIAEEEAAKAILLFDAVRCPETRGGEFKRLVREFKSHLAKCICASYYNTCPADSQEAQRIVEGKRRSFYRDGEYGEYILPNSFIHFREGRLYVDYFRNADGSHSWVAPLKPDVLFGDIVPSGVIEVVEALSKLQVFTRKGLQIVSNFWHRVSPEGLDWFTLHVHNTRMLEEMEKEGFEFSAKDDAKQLVVEKLLFPLYPFDLSARKNFDDLPPPEDPMDF